MSGNLAFRILQPLFVVIEVDQEDHMPVRALFHFADVIRLETVENLAPPACGPQYLELPAGGKVQVKAIGQLAVTVVFGQHQDVWPILVRGHDYTSSRISASTRSRSEEHTSELQSLRHLVCR